MSQKSFTGESYTVKDGQIKVDKDKPKTEAKTEAKATDKK